MKQIKTFDALRKLKPSTVVYHIANGNYLSYVIGGTIKQSGGLIIINNDSFKDIKFLYAKDFNNGVWALDFNLKEVGKLMVEQIKDSAKKEIGDIIAVYLTD